MWSELKDKMYDTKILYTFTNKDFNGFLEDKFKQKVESRHRIFILNSSIVNIVTFLKFLVSLQEYSV